MAKRRQRRKVYRPPVQKLENQFNCPECGQKKVVEVHFIKREKKGYLRCRYCREEYESKLKKASEPIDIYYNWINHREFEKDKKHLKSNRLNEDEEEGENENEEEELSKKNENDDDFYLDYNEEEGSYY